MDGPGASAGESGGTQAVERRARRSTFIVLGLLALLALASAFGIFRFVENERERTRLDWQVRLGIVADSRVAAVRENVARARAVVRDLADNVSLQLFLTELSLTGDLEQVTDREGQQDYLRNLLVLTARQSGFVAEDSGPEIAANVERRAGSGLVFLAADGRALVASERMPPFEPVLAALRESTPAGAPGFLDVFAGHDERPAVAFLEPVYSVQGDRSASDVVGYVLGIRQLDARFFEALRQPGEVLQSAESLLIRAEGGLVRYLSPLADGTAAFQRTLSRKTENLAAAALLEDPGGFGLYLDYRGTEVLATARAVPGLPWLLLRKVDRSEALGASDRRLSVLLTGLLLGLAVLVLAVLGLWRHGTSLRAAQSAERQRQSSARLAELSSFLQAVSDGQPTATIAVDRGGAISFANRMAGVLGAVEASELTGKSLTSAFGPRLGDRLHKLNGEALVHGMREETNEMVLPDGRTRLLRSTHIPLPDAAGERAAVLLVLDDVTSFVEEREARERIMRQLIETLVTIVDRRDPFSAHHSARVSEVAREIADEMSLDEDEVRCTDIAGALMNLGKVFVPREVLTKTGILSDAELAQVRDSILTSAELIQQIDFGMPVADTIRQIQERWDGSGSPNGLAGEKILQSARILAVANAFVAMVSARSWRAGLDFDRAAAALMEQSGSAFDRRPVSALLNLLDNRGFRENWEHFSTPPKDGERDSVSPD